MSNAIENLVSAQQRAMAKIARSVVFDYRLVRVLVLAWIVIAPISAAAAAPNYIPIVTARVQAEGTTVAVMGLVTVPSGVFRSSTEDEGFAIQDQTAGIWISVKENLKFKVGQRVLVSGTLGQSHGKLQIVPNSLADVEALPGVKLTVATGQVGIATLRSREPSRRTVSSMTFRMATRCS